MLFRIVFIPLFILILFPAWGQSYFKSNDIPVYEGSVRKILAWEGGLNAPQFSAADLDVDGREELVIFDRTHAQIHILKHTNDQIYEPHVIKGAFPTGLLGWVLLRDYNGDGKKDIFCYGGLGAIAVYRNESTPEAGIVFQEVVFPLKTRVVFPGNSYTTEIYVNIADIPAITDLDGDGDQDILTFTFAGSTVEFHKNLSVERTGQPGLDFELRNSCWAYFEENSEGNTVDLGIKTCENQVDDPEKSAGKHTGSTLASFNIDNDQVKDIIIGDVSFNTLLGITIRKSSMGGDSAIAQELFPSNSPVNITVFPAVFDVDVNRDGKNDFLAAPNATAGIDNKTGCWYYENTGTAGAPYFELRKTGYLQEDMIDLGEGAFPLYYDLDQDGLRDLLVSSKGTSTGDGNYLSRLFFYRNTGSLSNPIFTLQSQDAGGLSGLSLGFGLVPSFGELDGDASPELVIGSADGRLHYLQADPGNLNAFMPTQSPLKDNSGNTIDVGDYAHPCLYDVDYDGRQDLVIGERQGNFNYYRNVGTASQPLFQKITEAFGNVTVQEVQNEAAYSTACLYNQGGADYLLSGSRSGRIKLFRIADPAGNFETVNSYLGSIYEGQRVAPTSADLNNDGLPDLLLGNFGGGVNLYLQQAPNDIPAGAAVLLHIYPNPAGEYLVIESRLGGAYEIFDYSGRTVARGTAGAGTHHVHLEGMEQGIYLLRMSGASGPGQVARFVIE